MSTVAARAHAVVNGRRTRPTPTLTEYANRWLAGRTELKPTTLEHYRNMLRLYVLPAIGHVPVDRLTMDDVQRLDATMASGEHPKGQITRGHARTMLATVLKAAYQDRLVPAIVTEHARKLVRGAARPVNVDKVRAIDAQSMRKLLAASSGSRFELLIALMGWRGLRIGEALGLGWDRVDLDRGELRVTRNLVRVGTRSVMSTPTSQDSERSVKLGLDLVAAFRRWKATQAAEQLASVVWVEEHDFPAVFTDEAGRPLTRDAARAKVPLGREIMPGMA